MNFTVVFITFVILIFIMVFVLIFTIIDGILSYIHYRKLTKEYEDLKLQEMKTDKEEEQ